MQTRGRLRHPSGHMANRAPCFPNEALVFLRELKANNSRDWFTPRKADFDRLVKAPMIGVIEALNQHLVAFAPDHLVEPAKAVYRIYRDTRFSKDKTPYKTHIAATFARHGMDRHAAAGYYFSFGADRIEVAAGVYMPGPEELLQLRQYISGHFAEFSAILSDKANARLTGPLQGDTLSRPPKGFPVEDPAIEWIKRKQWFYYDTSLDPVLGTTPKFVPEIAKRFRAMAPLVNYLNRPLLDGRRRDPLLDH